jgi:hypothetical protein
MALFGVATGSILGRRIVTVFLHVIGQPGPSLGRPEKENPPIAIGNILSNFKAMSCIKPITGGNFSIRGHVPTMSFDGATKRLPAASFPRIFLEFAASRAGQRAAGKDKSFTEAIVCRNQYRQSAFGFQAQLVEACT